MFYSNNFYFMLIKKCRNLSNIIELKSCYEWTLGERIDLCLWFEVDDFGKLDHRWEQVGLIRLLTF